MTTFIDEDLDIERAYFITHRMTKQLKKFPKTEPFHSKRKCRHKSCVWHGKEA